MKITFFNSKETDGKSPISPYDDLTFDFKTLEVSTLRDAFRVMSNQFILNLPLEEDIRTFRRKTNLKNSYPKTFDYIVLDIDKVKNLPNKTGILNYFKGYECILGESRSYNGIDNFNLKGILRIEPTNLDNVKILLDQLHDDIAPFGDLDISVARIPSLNAPIKKYKVLLEGKGSLFKFVFRPSYKSKELNEIINNHFEIPKNLKLTGNTLDQICLQVFESMGFSALKSNGNCIVFKHPSETKTPGGYFWFRDNPFTMHHYNEQKSINIFNDVSKLPEAKELLRKGIDYNNSLLNFNTSTSVINVNSPFLEVNESLKASISSFLAQKDGLFAIRSPMGTGKSVVIAEIIKMAHEEDMRVLVCTNRISVAEDFTIKYNMKLYNKDKYKNNDSIIVQYDSLWRYNIRNFDVIILDEFISLLLHSRNCLNNTASNIGKFFACFNKKLVIADAFLTGYENCFFNPNKGNLWLLCNEYRDNIPIYAYSNYNGFVQEVVQTSRREPVTVSSTSLIFLHALKMILTKFGRRVVTLTSDTPKMMKEHIYKLFRNPRNDEYDVLIYSPTLTVGVSNLNNVGVHFHYDGSCSCDVISSLQMIKRTRKAKEIHLYIKNKIQFLKTTFKELRDDYIQNLGKYAEHNYIFELNDYGEVKLSRIGKNAINVDVLSNILESNHKEAFMFLLKYQFKNPPKEITKTFPTNILLPYIKEYKENISKYQDECLEQYLGMTQLDKSSMLDIKRQDLFEVLGGIESKLIPCAPKKEILELALKKRNFFDKMLKYKITKKFFLKELEKQDIQNFISRSLNVNKEDLKFWNAVLNFDSVLFDSYPPTALKNKKLATILEGVGYHLTEDLLRKYEMDKDIAKYAEFIDESKY